MIPPLIYEPRDIFENGYRLSFLRGENCAPIFLRKANKERMIGARVKMIETVYIIVENIRWFFFLSFFKYGLIKAFLRIYSLRFHF